MLNRKIIALAVLGLIGSAAHATIICPDGTQPGDHYNNDCHAAIKPLPPTIVKGGNPVTNNNTLGQQQQQAQLQAQRAEAAAKAAAVARSDAKATGGASSSEANGNGFNGTIAVSGGSTVNNARTNIIPPFIPSNVAPLPSAAIATVQGQCGGQVMVLQRQIVGREAHMIRATTEFEFGVTEFVRPLTDGNGTPTPFDLTTMPGYVLGHQWTRTTGQAQTSIDASFSANLLGKNGGGGAGTSGGGQLSQPTSSIDVQVCVLASPTSNRHTPAPLAARPVIKPRRVAVGRRICK